jgi:hypothetical protein
LQKGEVKLTSSGPIAFGPEGILFVGDPQASAIVAIATGDTQGDPEGIDYNIEGIDKKLAAALGVEPGDILINDVAVNPASGKAYLSISRGAGPDATPLIVRVTPDGEFEEVSLEDAQFSRAELPNPPAEDANARVNPRTLAITDLAFVDGQVIVAGLSNEEFASTLRFLPFPFTEANQGTGVEIFHGAHGEFETHAPVRTFATYEIEQESYVLAAYTCTPLVKFPFKQLTPGAQIRGVTVAELGNRNQPLDMVIYNQDGRDYILLANSRRGVMKISTDDIQREEGITEKIEDRAGQQYETVDGWTGIVHLDRLNSKNVLMLSQLEDGSRNLFSAPLP